MMMGNARKFTVVNKLTYKGVLKYNVVGGMR